ncbi:MAG: hypothetical protein PHV06_09390 [bacterium]|nr:hypothetical protein [bacterium]
MKRKINSLFLLLTMLIVFLSSNAFTSAETFTGEKPIKFYHGAPKKDPILASSISWYIPGGGQFYSENYLKGSIFLLVEAGLFVTTLGLITNYSYDLGNGFLVDAKHDVSLEDKQLAWGLGTLLLGLHIYNIVDAYHTAKRFNNSIDSELMENNLQYIYSDRKDPFIAGLLSWKMPGLGQIYTKEYNKGSKFMLGSIALKMWGFYLYQDLEDKYDPDSLGITWKELSENDKNLIITYGLFYISFELINIFDSINCAKEYNKKQEGFFSKYSGSNIAYDPEKESFKLVYSWKF